VLFDPARNDHELFDTLAEQQADAMPDKRDRHAVNSTQLRRFFGEIKDLYRRYNAIAAAAGNDGAEKQRIYHQQIEPQFKMIRSKVSYATRPGGQAKLSREFAHVLDQGIVQVEGPDQFRRFVMHLEAVIGFMYGKGKVRE
jgi:CRISPR-associated protein Csm2